MPGYTTPLAFPYPVDADAARDAMSTIPKLAAEKMNDYLTALSAVAPAAWTDCAMRPNFDHIIGVRTQVARRAGEVTLAIGLNPSVAYGANVWAFTIPGGFVPTRPLYIEQVGALADGAKRSLLIATDGAVTVRFAGSGAMVGTVTYAI